MFQPFRKSTQASTPDLSAATAQQGKLDNQAKQRANALRQQNIGNTMYGAKLYNDNVDSSPISDYFDKYNSPTADLNAPLPASEAPGMSSSAPMSPAAPADPFTTMGNGPAGSEMLAGTEAAASTEAAVAGTEAAAVGSELATAAEIGGAATGTTAGSGFASTLGASMPYLGAAMALYSLLNQ
jgi:hypothetical protein